MKTTIQSTQGISGPYRSRLTMEHFRSVHLHSRWLFAGISLRKFSGDLYLLPRVKAGEDAFCVVAPARTIKPDGPTVADCARLQIGADDRINGTYAAPNLTSGSGEIRRPGKRTVLAIVWDRQQVLLYRPMS